MPFRFVLTGALAILLVSDPALAGIRGHASPPRTLSGLWEISLCVSDTHAWIGYRNLETGEIHTSGRYLRGFGSVVESRTGRTLWPNAYCCGVLWDWDLMYNHLLRKEKRVLRVVQIQDPVIYRGSLMGYGHLGVRLNCVTYARDAWNSYTGEFYRLPLIATPRALESAVRRGPPASESSNPSP